jgi:hypothetical protein
MPYRWDMSPRLVAMGHRPVQGVGNPIHLSTHVGRRHHQVKAPQSNLYEPTQASSNLIIKKARVQSEHPEEDSKIDSNTMEASNRPLQTNYLKYEPVGHVNPFVDIEIISSQLSNLFSIFIRATTL